MQNYERPLLDSSCLSVCPFVRPSVSTCAWKKSFPTGRIFKKFVLSVFLKSVKKIKVSLSPDKNNGYPTSLPIYMYDNITLDSSQIEKCFRQNLQRKSNHTFIFNTFFRKSSRLLDDVENMVDPDRPQLTT